MEKTIVIDGQEVKFKSTAALTRIYRMKFGKDILQDMVALKKAYVRVVGNNKKDEKLSEKKSEELFSMLDLQTFENVAYIMAVHADNEIEKSAELWLEKFNFFSIYEILPEILGLWLTNEQTMVESKKKLNKLNGR